MPDPALSPFGPTDLVGPNAAIFHRPYASQYPDDPYQGGSSLIDPTGMPYPDPTLPQISPYGLGAPPDPDDVFVPPGYGRIKPPQFGGMPRGGFGGGPF